MKTQILYLIKFFKKEEHADQFIKGLLHLKTISYFKNLEATEDINEDGRPDRNEAIAHWWQPKDFRMKITLTHKSTDIDPNIPNEFEISGEDLADPVSMSYDYHNYLHIFCIYAMHIKGFQVVNGQIECTEKESYRLKKQLEVDHRNFKFGEFAVIVPAVQFLKHMKSVLQEHKISFEGRLIDYYDESSFNGEIKLNDIPFKKHKKYSYQHEFRICVNTKTKSKEPLNIEVGDISHICAKIKSSTINEILSITSTKVTNESISSPTLDESTAKL